MQNAIDEIMRLRALWAKEEADAKARGDAAEREKREHRRDALRAGQWKPSCCCDVCLRAVFSLTAPEGFCKYGKNWGW